MKIALIILDTLRKDKISPYNNSINHTPNIQKFSEESQKYTNALCQAPWSFPSQTSIFTGKYPWQHGASQKQPYIKKSTTTIAEKLSESNIKTAAIHDNTWLMPITNAMKGFEEIETPNNRTKYLEKLWRYSNKSPLLSKISKRALLANSKRNLGEIAEKTTDSTKNIQKTEEFLSNNEDDFFLFINLLNTHYPYNPPEKYRNKHNIKKNCTDLETRPSEYGGPVLENELEEIEKLYDAEVDYLDDVFGKIIEKFKEHNIYEETLIIVAADHGEALGENETLGHHFSTQEELINVPLMIKHPKKEAKVISEATELREIHYKILNHAGLEAEDNEKLIPHHACGIYEKPVIYQDKISEKHKEELNKPQFYIKSENKTFRTNKVALKDLSENHELLKTNLDINTDLMEQVNMKRT